MSLKIDDANKDLSKFTATKMTQRKQKKAKDYHSTTRSAMYTVNNLEWPENLIILVQSLTVASLFFSRHSDSLSIPLLLLYYPVLYLAFS